VESYSPDVGGNRGTALAANFPVSALVAQAERREFQEFAIPMPAGICRRLRRKLKAGWRPHQDQHVEPAGNEQIAAMYVSGILAKEGIQAELLTWRRDGVRWSLVSEARRWRTFKGAASGGAPGYRASG